MQTTTKASNNSLSMADLASISLVRLPTVIAISDASLDGFHLNFGSDSEFFIQSDTGINFWLEKDGACGRIEGKAQARLLQTPKGPMVQILKEINGIMTPNYHVLCVDLMGISPLSPSNTEERFHLYRDMLVYARNERIIH